MASHAARSALGSVLFLVLAGCAGMPRVGDVAPDFTAATDQADSFRLGELRGKYGVVLYFYGSDETPQAAALAHAFRDRIESFTRNGYKVVAVGSDTVESHRAFRARHRLTFPLVADPKGRVFATYGVRRRTPKPRKKDQAPVVQVKCVVFVIDKDGIVKACLKPKNAQEAVAQALTYVAGR